jgi:hypothetical protein
MLQVLVSINPIWSDSESEKSPAARVLMTEKWTTKKWTTSADIVRECPIVVSFIFLSLHFSVLLFLLLSEPFDVPLLDSCRDRRDRASSASWQPSSSAEPPTASPAKHCLTDAGRHVIPSDIDHSIGQAVAQHHRSAA